MKTALELAWPLAALVALFAAVAAFDPGAAGQILRAAIEVLA